MDVRLPCHTCGLPCLTAALAAVTQGCTQAVALAVAIETFSDDVRARTTMDRAGPAG